MIRIFGVAVLLFAFAVAGLELFWRSQGHLPAIVDDADLWCRERDRATEAGAVVLIGASRLHWGFSPEVFRERLPDRTFVQLSDRWSPVAVLRDLASDEAFHGVVIVSTLAERFERDHWDDQQPLVDYCQTQWSPSNQLDRVLRSWVEAALVVVNPNVGLLRVGSELLEAGRFPDPLWVETRADRTRRADFELLDPGFARIFVRKLMREGALRGSAYAHSTPEEWLVGVREIEGFVARIQARGGRVVFVRLPSAGPVSASEEERYPRSDYWQALERTTRAVSVHFRDVPELRNIELPDGSHPDRRSAARYTEALLTELEARGVLR